jgi:hypothetical protein
MTFLPLALAVLCPSIVSTQSDVGPSYNYLQLNAGLTRYENLGDDGEILGIAASFELSDSIFLYADYGDNSASVGGALSDITALEVGVGAYVSVAPSVDFFASAGFLSADSDLSGDEDGHVLGAGLRAKASNQLELNAGLKETSTGEDDSALWFGAVFNLTDNLGVSATFMNGDDYDGFMVGLRLYL